MRVSVSRSDRTDSMSRRKPGSRRRLSRALTSAPRPVLTGSSWATSRPRRTIVKCSPRCSTASRMSEKFLAASVALTSGTESDYQIYGDRNDGASAYPRHGARCANRRTVASRRPRLGSDPVCLRTVGRMFMMDETWASSATSSVPLAPTATRTNPECPLAASLPGGEQLFWGHDPRRRFIRRRLVKHGPPDDPPATGA